MIYIIFIPIKPSSKPISIHLSPVYTQLLYGEVLLFKLVTIVCRITGEKNIINVLKYHSLFLPLLPDKKYSEEKDRDRGS